MTLLRLAALAGLAASANAHMTVWTSSMWGRNLLTAIPIAPNHLSQASWWMGGPARLADTPIPGEYTELRAGTTITMEIACHIAWTSYGVATTKPGSFLDACPNNVGAYHSGDPTASAPDPKLYGGCALAIADVANIEDVTWDNLVVFSVQYECVAQKLTTFDIPAKMPACSQGSCIATWLWLAANGTANYYMTPFRAKVTGSSANALPIAGPSDAVFCLDDPAACTPGAKRPLYAYNYPQNTIFPSNYHRPRYHQEWGFANGAQNDIFEKSANVRTLSQRLVYVASPKQGAEKQFWEANIYLDPETLLAEAPRTTEVVHQEAGTSHQPANQHATFTNKAHAPTTLPPAIATHVGATTHSHPAKATTTKHAIQAKGHHIKAKTHHKVIHHHAKKMAKVPRHASRRTKHHHKAHRHGKAACKAHGHH